MIPTIILENGDRFNLRPLLVMEIVVTGLACTGRRRRPLGLLQLVSKATTLGRDLVELAWNN